MVTDSRPVAEGIIRSERPSGFNVIGHLSTSSGLGNTARQFIQLLSSLDYGVTGIDVDYDGGAEWQQIEGVSLVNSVDDLPYTHNLIIVSLPALPSLWLHKLPKLLAPKFRNVGLVFWELPVVPKAWGPALALFDAILRVQPLCAPRDRNGSSRCANPARRASPPGKHPFRR